MSRRCHHGSPRHPRVAGREPARDRRHGPVLADRSGSPPLSTHDDVPSRVIGASGLGDVAPADAAPIEDFEVVAAEPGSAAAESRVAAVDVAPMEVVALGRAEDVAGSGRTGDRRRPRALRAAPETAATAEPTGDQGTQRPAPERGGQEHAGPPHEATAPQLRRFIKSRAYVPMHELRRRFAINGSDDDVTLLEVDRRRVYVGLPEREGRLLGELVSGGDIGVELSLDPISPIVVGVFPIRPIPRS